MFNSLRFAALALALAGFPAHAAIDELPPQVLDFDARTRVLHLRETDGTVRELPDPHDAPKKASYIAGSLILLVTPSLKRVSSLAAVTKVRVTGTILTTGELKDAILGLTPNHPGLRDELSRAIPYWRFMPRLKDCRFEEYPVELRFDIDTTGLREKYIYERSESLAKRVATESRAPEICFTEPVQKVQPKFPQNARRMIQDGVVLIAYLAVDAQGKVSTVSVGPHAYHEYFAPEAIVALRQWKFPATDQGFCGHILIDFKFTN